MSPITHVPPTKPDAAIEIPAVVKRRLGLDGQRSWIVTDELNKFIWPGYDLRPVSRDKPAAFAWGFLPQELFDTLKQSVVAHQRARRLKFVERA